MHSPQHGGEEQPAEQHPGPDHLQHRPLGLGAPGLCAQANGLGSNMPAAGVVWLVASVQRSVPEPLPPRGAASAEVAELASWWRNPSLAQSGIGQWHAWRACGLTPAESGASGQRRGSGADRGTPLTAATLLRTVCASATRLRDMSQRTDSGSSLGEHNKVAK